MNQIFILIWSVLTFVLLSAGISAAEKPTEIFNQWSAFKSTSGGSCYTISGGTKGLRLYKSQIGKSNKFEFSIYSKNSFKKAATALLTIDNKLKFVFYGHPNPRSANERSYVWSHPNDDFKIDKALKNGTKAVFTSKNSYSWFSLIGYTNSSNWMDSNCFQLKVKPQTEAKVKPKVKTCFNDPSLCTVTELCQFATTYKSGGKVWATDQKKKVYVTEAKKNGLNCGLKVEVVKKPKDDEIIPASSGSGFYVSKSGHIVTNNHVIKHCKSVKVHLREDTVLNAKILFVDVLNDLALIKTNNTPEVVFALSKETPYLDQDIRVAGYPLVSTLGRTLKVTRGVVSALSAPGNPSNIQMDAAVQPGNSGGPIFDDLGNILGVVVAKLDSKDAQNVNFGIKASTVRNLLDANNVKTLEPRTVMIDKREFSGEMDKGTVLLSCWMTMAQIEKLKTKKVLFKEFE